MSDSGIVSIIGKELLSNKEPEVIVKEVKEGYSYIIGVDALSTKEATSEMTSRLMKSLKGNFPDSKFIVIAGLKSVNELKTSKEALLEEIDRRPKDMDSIIKSAVTGEGKPIVDKDSVIRISPI